MSRGPENTFIAGVHKHLPASVYHMKNHNQYVGGVADVWYSGVRDLWVEYKFIAVPARAATPINLLSDKALSPLQQQWLRARHGEGRSVGVVVGCAGGGVWFPGTSWEEPISAGLFRQRLLKRADVAALIERETSG